MFDNDTSEFIDSLLERCSFPPAATAFPCGVSGGADSMALLVLAAAAGCAAHAFHVDHGLRAGSGCEADLVRSAAARFGGDFTALRIDLAVGPNLEARARRARYDALPVDVATGHTADDQAETVLLALLRGSAWQGLGGMRPGVRRPLLALRRAETVELCQRLAIPVVDDASNDDPAFRRNRVRHELIPLVADIAERDIVPVLARQAELFRQGGDLLAVRAEPLDPCDAPGLVAAPEVLARAAVRAWIWSTRGDDHPPDLATVDRVLAVARLDATATEVGQGWRVERSRQRLRLVPPPSSRPLGSQA